MAWKTQPLMMKKSKRMTIKNHQKIQRKKKDEDCDVLKLTMVEGLGPSSCLPAQLTQQEHEVHPDSPMCKPSGNTDVGPFPELPATPKGQERAERAGKASSSRNSGTTEPSTSSPHLGDHGARLLSTASRLKGRAFHWLNHSVLSMGRRRQGSEQATRSCPQQAPHRRRCLRGKKVQPDGPPGQLGPRMPTFSRYVLPHHEKFEED
ncbi:uncharacterized protein LOC104865203 [Fukomys damarensis]|uniref:uncharacterized protein LOC104865203 n=1 Tax=Fukomys damarensis TaxID=885580 RepID=UPI00053FE9BF|nr:uncharacterized protein LOC104865203 [Fukomys damarensis]